MSRALFVAMLRACAVYGARAVTRGGRVRVRLERCCCFTDECSCVGGIEDALCESAYGFSWVDSSRFAADNRAERAS